MVSSAPSGVESTPEGATSALRGSCQAGLLATDSRISGSGRTSATCLKCPTQPRLQGWDCLASEGWRRDWPGVWMTQWCSLLRCLLPCVTHCAVAEPTVDEARDASGAVQSLPVEMEAAPGHTEGELRGGQEGHGTSTSCHLHAPGEAQWRTKAGVALGHSGPGSPDYVRPCDVLPGLSDFAEPRIAHEYSEVGPCTVQVVL